MIVGLNNGSYKIGKEVQSTLMLQDRLQSVQWVFETNDDYSKVFEQVLDSATVRMMEISVFASFISTDTPQPYDLKA